MGAPRSSRGRALTQSHEGDSIDMCDYSSMGIPNRLATAGEELVTHRFYTGSIGLASPSDLRRSPAAFWSKVQELLDAVPKPVPAVCIPPGASLRLMDIPERLRREFGIGPTEDVMFTQLTAAVNTYRDAVRFCNGSTVGLQQLSEGQRIRVLALASEDPNDTAVPGDTMARTGCEELPRSFA